jgi:hypothetical protein
MAIKTQKTEQVDAFITVEKLDRAEMKVHLLGSTALVMNRMPAKARQQLLWPMRKLNKAAREQTQKHNPYLEYRDSIYRCSDPHAPTLVHIPNGAIKKAMANAAIDIPGATKAQIGRLVKVLDPTVHIYGKPFLYMDIVRQAGINKTPDIRTRAMFPTWACSLTIRYIRNLIREQDVYNLLDAAGDIIGIGDGRTEKGTFDNGSWIIVDPDDKQWHAIVKNGGRKAQEAAMAKPEAINSDTEELLAWFDTEVVRREKEKDGKPQQRTERVKIVATKPRKGGDGTRVHA